MRILLTIALVALNNSVAIGADLPRSTPESQGVCSSAVLAFIEAADRDLDSLHSVMLLRHGHVVAEGWWSPYHAAAPHSLYSLSKSFTSTAVGLAIAEGKLSLDDEVLKFFPEGAPAEPSNNLKAMRVSDLLRMSTGQQTEPPRTPDQPWTKTFLAHPVPFKPGTHFMYNTSATYMASAIVQKATGETVLDSLRPRLFEPLGIEHPTWETSPQGISTGGYGLSIRTEDIARFGQLYLQKVKRQGKQLVPEAWVDAATAGQTSNGSNPNSDSGSADRRAGRAVLPGRRGAQGSGGTPVDAIGVTDFFRFCRQRGQILQPLDRAVPSLRTYKLASVPRGLSAEQVQQVLRGISTARRRAVAAAMPSCNCSPATACGVGRCGTCVWTRSTGHRTKFCFGLPSTARMPACR